MLLKNVKFYFRGKCLSIRPKVWALWIGRSFMYTGVDYKYLRRSSYRTAGRFLRRIPCGTKGARQRLMVSEVLLLCSGFVSCRYRKSSVAYLEQSFKNVNTLKFKNNEENFQLEEGVKLWYMFLNNNYNFCCTNIDVWSMLVYGYFRFYTAVCYSERLE